MKKLLTSLGFTILAITSFITVTYANTGPLSMEGIRTLYTLETIVSAGTIGTTPMHLVFIKAQSPETSPQYVALYMSIEHLAVAGYFILNPEVLYYAYSPSTETFECCEIPANVLKDVTRLFMNIFGLEEI